MATIRVDADDVRQALENAEIKYRVALAMYCQTHATKFENYAKLHRPWRDRTGQARQRLTGYIETDWDSYKIRICVAHGVEYGRDLEFKHNEKYAILYPTIKKLSWKVLAGLNILKGIFS